MEIPADDPFWDLAIADPGPFGLFLGAVYDRARRLRPPARGRRRCVLAASREWLTRYDDSTATTDDFEALFEDVSGEDLTTFFDVWVRTRPAHAVSTRARVDERSGAESGLPSGRKQVPGCDRSRHSARAIRSDEVRYVFRRTGNDPQGTKETE